MFKVNQFSILRIQDKSQFLLRANHNYKSNKSKPATSLKLIKRKLLNKKHKSNLDKLFHIQISDNVFQSEEKVPHLFSNKDFKSFYLIGKVSFDNSFSKQITAHLIPSINLLTHCSPNIPMLIHKDEIHQGALRNFLSLMYSTEGFSIHFWIKNILE